MCAQEVSKVLDRDAVLQMGMEAVGDSMSLGMKLSPLNESAAKGIPVTIMYHRVTRQVLFLEAGKDFVDLVMGFLTLPIGSIIKLLSESALVTPKTVGSIFNVFESIPRLEAEEKMCADKKLLIDPKPTCGLRFKYLDTENPEAGICNGSDNGAESAPKFYYTCTAIPHCSYVSGRSGTKCPRHQRKMTTQCQLIDGNETAMNVAPDGYVKNGNKFFIADNLEIFPDSKSLVLLKKLKVENMSFLDSLDIHVGTEEVLQLLRASLTSGSVLSEVFGKELNNRDTYVLASLREILSHTDSISNMSYELLRSIERGKRFKVASSVDPRHRERRVYSALREIDHAYQARLAVCIGERELQISSALSGALRDLDSSSTASETTSRSSRILDQKDGQKEERVDQKVVDREVLTTLCKEVVMPEKQGSMVVEKRNHLAICAPPTVEPLPPNSNLPPNQKPSVKFPLVKPPWITSLTTYTPRCRNP